MRRKAKTTNPSATERARRAADAAGFGPWERSLRVNGLMDRDDLITGAVLVCIAPWLPIAAGLYPPRGPWWLFAIGAIFLCAGLAVFFLAWRRRRLGPALIHLFGNGAVLERTRGPLFTLPYADTPVDHIRWRESIDGAEGKQLRQNLQITLPDSRTVVLDCCGKAEPQDLSFIAERWGLSPEPRFLEKQPKTHPLW